MEAVPVAGAVHVRSTSPAVHDATAVKVCGADGVVCARALLTNREVEVVMINSAARAIVARNARGILVLYGMMRADRGDPLALGYQINAFGVARWTHRDASLRGMCAVG